MKKKETGASKSFTMIRPGLGYGIQFADFSRRIVEKYAVTPDYPWSQAVMQLLLRAEDGVRQENRKSEIIYVTLNLLRFYLTKQQEYNQVLGNQQIFRKNLQQNIEVNLSLIRAYDNKMTKQISHLYQMGLQMEESMRLSVFQEIEQEYKRIYHNSQIQSRSVNWHDGDVNGTTQNIMLCSTSQPFAQMMTLITGNKQVLNHMELFRQASIRQQAAFYLRIAAESAQARTKSMLPMRMRETDLIESVKRHFLQAVPGQILKLPGVFHQRAAEIIFTHLGEAVFIEQGLIEPAALFKIWQKADLSQQHKVFLDIVKAVNQVEVSESSDELAWKEIADQWKQSIEILELFQLQRSEDFVESHSETEQWMNQISFELLQKVPEQIRQLPELMYQKAAEMIFAHLGGADQMVQGHMDYAELVKVWQAADRKEQTRILAALAFEVRQLAKADSTDQPILQEIADRWQQSIHILEQLRYHQGEKHEVIHLAMEDAIGPEAELSSGQLGQYLLQEVPEQIRRLPELVYQKAAEMIVTHLGTQEQMEQEHMDHAELVKIWLEAGQKEQEKVLADIAFEVRRLAEADSSDQSFLQETAERWQQSIHILEQLRQVQGEKREVVHPAIVDVIGPESELSSGQIGQYLLQEVPEQIRQLPELVYQKTAEMIVTHLGTQEQMEQGRMDFAELAKVWQEADYEEQQRVLADIAFEVRRLAEADSPNQLILQETAERWQQSIHILEQLRYVRGEISDVIHPAMVDAIRPEAELGSGQLGQYLLQEVPEQIRQLPELVYQKAAEIIFTHLGGSEQMDQEHINYVDVVKIWNNTGQEEQQRILIELASEIRRLAEVDLPDRSILQETADRWQQRIHILDQLRYHQGEKSEVVHPLMAEVFGAELVYQKTAKVSRDITKQAELVYMIQQQAQKNVESVQNNSRDLETFEIKVLEQEQKLQQEWNQLEDVKQILGEHSEDIRSIRETQKMLLQKDETANKLTRNMMDEIKTKLRLERIRHGLD